LSVEETPDDARPVLPAVGDTPRVPPLPRLAPNRFQVAAGPDDARGLVKEDALRKEFGAEDAAREPENAFDLQPDEPEVPATEEPPREPKKERPEEDGAGDAARGAEKPRQPPPPRPPPPPNPRLPRAAP
jgi:hypothetical protein